MTDRNEEFEFYWSGPFSQWHRSEFELDGVGFNTAEQAMMYHKALLFADHGTAQLIMGTNDPQKQKALGRQVKGFKPERWDAHKEEIVRRANQAKFGQNRGLRRKLFQTGNRMLAEASPLDAIWGIGLDEETARATPPENWPGKNLLGKFITDVREELRVLYPVEADAVANDNR